MIYGPNGVGKSSLIEAMRVLRERVMGPRPIQGIKRPLAERPVEFNLDFVHQGAQYGYRVRLSDLVLEERLTMRPPEGRTQLVFARTPGSEGSEWQFGAAYEVRPHKLMEGIAPDVLFVAANRTLLLHPVFAPVLDWFANWTISPTAKERARLVWPGGQASGGAQRILAQCDLWPLHSGCDQNARQTPP